MYNDYNSQFIYVKAKATRLINEAAQDRQVQELRLCAETKSPSKQKKAFFSSFGTISSANTLIRHDI